MHIWGDGDPFGGGMALEPTAGWDCLAWFGCIRSPDDHCRSIYDLFFAWSPWMRSGCSAVQVDPQ